MPKLSELACVWYTFECGYDMNGKEYTLKANEPLEVFGEVKGGLKVFTPHGHIIDIAFIPNLMGYKLKED